MTRRLLLIAVLFFAARVALGALSASDPIVPSRPLSSLPMTLGPWTGAPLPDFDPQTLSVLGVDDYVTRLYRRGPDAADLYVGYYASQKRGGTIHSPLNCLPAAGWEPLSYSRVQLTGDPSRPIHANRYVIQRGLDRELVLYWFQSHGRTVASEYWNKAYLIFDGLTLHRTDGTLVRVVVGPFLNEARAERTATDFIHVLAPQLNRQLPR
ncbi:MAG: exosortase C-terminal domain/associated protein EpsI [Vicinamibacterales bacterium]